MSPTTQEIHAAVKALDADFASADSEIHNIPESAAAPTDVNLAAKAMTNLFLFWQGEVVQKPAASKKPL